MHRCQKCTTALPPPSNATPPRTKWRTTASDGGPLGRSPYVVHVWLLNTQLSQLPGRTYNTTKWHLGRVHFYIHAGHMFSWTLRTCGVCLAEGHLGSVLAVDFNVSSLLTAVLLDFTANHLLTFYCLVVCIIFPLPSVGNKGWHRNPFSLSTFILFSF